MDIRVHNKHPCSILIIPTALKVFTAIVYSFKPVLNWNQNFSWYKYLYFYGGNTTAVAAQQSKMHTELSISPWI